MLLSGTADAASMANVLKAYKTTSQWQEAGGFQQNLTFEKISLHDII